MKHFVYSNLMIMTHWKPGIACLRLCTLEFVNKSYEWQKILEYVVCSSRVAMTAAAATAAALSSASVIIALLGSAFSSMIVEDHALYNHNQS